MKKALSTLEWIVVIVVILIVVIAVYGFFPTIKYLLSAGTGVGENINDKSKTNEQTKTQINLEQGFYFISSRIIFS